MIGVLALQGAFREHRLAFEDVATREVRTPEDLEGLSGLVIPGGESTTIGKLLERFGLLEPLRSAPFPIWGTCAGMILLAREIKNGLPGQPCLGKLDIVVERNAYGRQVESFEANLELLFLGDGYIGDGPLFPGVFIRAPRIVSCGPHVQVLGRYQDAPVVVKQGNVVASSFHPELSHDRRFHRWFAALCASS